MPAPQPDPEISIVVPLFQEAEVLPALLEALRATLDPLGRPWELICVDDGSRDATPALLQEAAAADPRLVPVLLSRNFGKEAAMAAGLEAARGGAVVLMDGDLQHPPALLPTLIARWDEGWEVVGAVKERPSGEGPAYRLAAWAFNRLMGRAVGRDFGQESDFKLLDRQVVDALLACPERNRFFRGLVAWVGFRVTHVPFTVQARPAGASSWSTAGLVRYAARNLLAFSSFPLVAIAWLGLAVSIASAALGVQTLYNWARGTAVTGFTTTILSVLGMGGVILICLGVVAAYLAVVYDELKRRPLYLARSPRAARRPPMAQPASASSDPSEAHSPADSPSGQ
jgi:dolichol-phosphate mannosyltransferase